MKKTIISLFFTILFLSSCGRYVATSGGKDDVGYVAVIKENPKAKFENVELVIDGKSFIINKVESNDKFYKVKPVSIAPGKHQVKVLVNGTVVAEENILVGLQETRKIFIR